MTAAEYDIVAVGDFRFPGGSSTGAAEQIRAQARAGYRTGLIQVKGPVLKFPHAFNPQIRQCLDDGAAVLLDPEQPVKARLALAYHPQIFTHLPSRPLMVQAERRLLVVCHPLVDAAGNPYYDWAAIDANAQEALGGDIQWAPVGPLVRAPVHALPNPPALFERDWLEIVDVDKWASRVPRPLGHRPVIGRHSRPDPAKWPDDVAAVFAVYPCDPRFRVRVLGSGRFLHDMVGSVPANWDLLTFNAEPVERFLETIDFFVYFHHSTWVEAFGRVIIEAMASGALAILPQHFQALCGDGAVYAAPDAVPDTVQELHGNADAFRRQAARGLEIVHDSFSHDAHVRRLEDLIGQPARTRIAMPHRPVLPGPRTQGRRVLLMTSNGVGMGHLTRMLAIARRCDPSITPVFLTMSQAMRVVETQGYLAEFLPFHGYLGADVAQWNHYLRHELNEMIGFYGASVLVFDGNVAYGGLVGALHDNPSCLGVWCRRALWRPGGASEENIKRETAFHAVLEPGELAGAHDAGLTTLYRGRTRAVDPIRLLDPPDVLERAAARVEIGLEPEGLAVLVQLGSGNNYDYDEIRDILFERLLSVPGLRIVVAEWMIAETPPPLPPGVQRLSTFPIARILPAFDFTIGAGGYNGFHEQIAAGIPSIFIPNENPMMDEQVIRAQYAESRGLGLCVRRRDIYRLPIALERMLDADFRHAMRTRCLTVPAANGAAEAARFIGELAHTVRADRNPREVWTAG